VSAFVSCEERRCSPKVDHFLPRHYPEDIPSMNQRPRLFPELPVLNDLKQRVPPEARRALSSVGMVCVQHLLETTGSLYELLFSLGVPRENVYILGKNYSTNQSVRRRLLAQGVNVYENNMQGRFSGFARTFDDEVSKLWERCSTRWNQKNAISRILVLDDGGHCVSKIPKSVMDKYAVRAIEQTTSGIRRLERMLQVPTINVALSAAKKYIEPPLISETIIEKVARILQDRKVENRSLRCGVIGYGNIGRAVVDSLLAHGHKVGVFDRRPLRVLPECTTFADMQDLITNSEYIFGCTGEDTIKDPKILNQSTGRKVFLSCSSEDREFRSLLIYLLREYPNKYKKGLDPKQTLELETRTLRMEIIRGGFPVNFDQQRDSVPAHDIQMTRGLLLGGLLQAALCDETNRRDYTMLNPYLQRFVVNRWLTHQEERRELYSDNLQHRFTEVKWIAEQSDGAFQKCDFMQSMFARP
jgi:hypothetical protein